MTKKSLLLTLVLLVAGICLQAQTTEELEAQKAAKEQELSTLEPQLADLTGKVNALKADLAALKDKLTPYPRWDVGALGNVGLSLAGFDNWFSKAEPNTRALNIGFTLNGFANLQQPKYFWRNGGNLVLAWQKFDDKDNPNDVSDLRVAADAFNLVSLFGFKLSEKIAISALSEYRTAVLDDRFNNPGYLDAGVGTTWTPLRDLVVVLHPLNYNFVFSRGDFNYESSLGCKVVADYTRALSKGIAWKSNFSGFLSYKNNDLSNWTWINGFSTAVKGVGVGLDVGLRGNKQEALAAGKTDNPVQVYYLLGLSYAIAAKK